MESKYQIPEQALADFSRGTGCESYKFLGAAGGYPFCGMGPQREKRAGDQ